MRGVLSDSPPEKKERRNAKQQFESDVKQYIPPKGANKFERNVKLHPTKGRFVVCGAWRWFERDVK